MKLTILVRGRGRGRKNQKYGSKYKTFDKKQYSILLLKMYFSFTFILYLSYFFSEHHSPHTPLSLPLFFFLFSSLSSPHLFLRLSLVLLFPLLLLLVPDDLYLRHYLRSLYIISPSPSNLVEFCLYYTITILSAITSSLALPITDFSISF